MKQSDAKSKSKSVPQQAQRQKPQAGNEISFESTGAGQPHNAKKEALGPNTKR